MVPILVFFVSHWCLSIFCQTFFLHRYGSHRMFTMSKGWERFFHLLTAFSQGSSFLQPRGYAILHREHHAYSDTPQRSAFAARLPGARQDDVADQAPLRRAQCRDHQGRTAIRRRATRSGRSSTASSTSGPRASSSAPLTRSSTWCTRLTGPIYLLLPIHYIMGPIHGAIVNYCGHMFGYRNFDTPHGDKSKNTLIFDFVTAGELFQNNHHARPQNPNFARALVRNRPDLAPSFASSRGSGSSSSSARSLAT